MSGNREQIENLKLAFVSENQFTGPVSPRITNRRTEYEWMIMLGTHHFHWSQIKENPGLLKDFDATIFVLPKNHPDEVETLRKAFGITTCILMQEGPSNYWLDYPVQIQLEYYKILQEVDAVFCHNEYDKNYYQAITSKPVYILPTFINLAYVLQNIEHPEKMKGTVFIGGNGTNWYNGVSSALATRNIEGINMIGFPTMGRMLPNEEILMRVLTNKEVRYIPFTDWTKFTITLGFFEYAIHLMPTIAAGSFMLQCAAMGTPCIGNKHVDTQRICFPDLSIEPYDIGKAKELLQRLINDKEFYNMVVTKARKNLEQFGATECAMQVRENISEVIKNGIKK